VHDCARQLVANAVEAGDGIGWNTTLPAWQPLAGFSHGASGMAHALIHAGSTLGEPRYTETALTALRYERSTFDASRHNWPDFRILGNESRPEQPSVMWAWCHGAPGVGLARLAALAHVNDPELARDLDTALGSTAVFGFGGNDSLCHGDLGNLELFLRARELGRTGIWERTLALESSRLVERISRGEWRCGIPGAIETPGLMMGLAGIGYGLLRLGATRDVPSLLSLEAPRRAPLERSAP
jgi:lantibiotic modifying enzyme